MRSLLVACMALVLNCAIAQQPCNLHSTLFKFDPHLHPRVFTERLGNHPQFPFLQYEKGITTRALFIASAKDPDSRKNYKIEFGVFNDLLKEVGFTGGYKDLKAANVENLFINPGTIGNLGFFNKESNYIYVKLNPAGEGDDGIAAWKITGPGGCYFYVLHTCGNAFFANDPNEPGTSCCHQVTLKALPDTPATANTSVDRPLHIHLRYYEATLVASAKHHGYDTLTRLLRDVDTLALVKDSSAGPNASTPAGAFTRRVVICKDTTLTLRIPLAVANQQRSGDTLQFVWSDTLWLTRYTNGPVCRKKWEIAVDGGGSVNTVPRFENTAIHSRTNGVHIAGELAISRIFNHWFQAGVSASYIILSYQDDVPYPGSAAGVYNSVYLGVPIIPVQLFGKATIGGPLGWQSTVSLSAGWSIPMKDRILNSNNTLTTQTGIKGGPTAGFKLGLAYFFNCKFGLAGTFTGQYFDNNSSLMHYHLVAGMATLGIRYRF